MSTECSVFSSAPTVRPMPAQGNALGAHAKAGQALKGRDIRADCRSGIARVWAAPSGLDLISWILPRALPWAGMMCPFGAQKPSAARVDGHLKKMGAVWK